MKSNKSKNDLKSRKKSLHAKKYKNSHNAINKPKMNLNSLQKIVGNIKSKGKTPSAKNMAVINVITVEDRNTALLELQRTHGNQYVQKVVGIQKKLKISEPGDIYEQEADKIAEMIVERNTSEFQYIQNNIEPGTIFRQPTKVTEEEKLYSEGEPPKWAMPLKKRMEINCQNNSFKDTVTSIIYSKVAMDSWLKNAKNDKKIYQELLNIIRSTHKFKEIDDANQFIQNSYLKAYAKVTGQKIPKGSSTVAAGQTHLTGGQSKLCKAEIIHDNNPFMIYPLWVHEYSHIKECAGFLREEKKEYLRSFDKDPTSRQMAERSNVPYEKVSEKYQNALTFIESDVKAYSNTINEIDAETKSFYEILNSCKQQKQKISRKEALNSDYHLDLVDTNTLIPADSQPLPNSVIRFFEPWFGDTSHVRIHTGEPSANAARSINALAFTLGQNVVFGAGQYAPNTERGLKLLAHELTHVMQQKEGTVSKKVAFKNHSPNIQRKIKTHREELENEALEKLPPNSVIEIKALIASEQFKKAIDKTIEESNLKNLINEETRKRISYEEKLEKLCRSSAKKEDEKKECGQIEGRTVTYIRDKITVIQIGPKAFESVSTLYSTLYHEHVHYTQDHSFDGPRDKNEKEVEAYYFNLKHAESTGIASDSFKVIDTFGNIREYYYKTDKKKYKKDYEWSKKETMRLLIKNINKTGDLIDYSVLKTFRDELLKKNELSIEDFFVIKKALK
jgi:hypothetical protein